MVVVKQMIKQIDMRRITLVLITFLSLALCASAQKISKGYIVGFYNLENLFDIYDDPVKNDQQFLPDGYQYELSPDYHLVAYSCFAGACELDRQARRRSELPPERSFGETHSACCWMNELPEGFDPFAKEEEK